MGLALGRALLGASGTFLALLGASGALLGRLRAVWALPVAWAPSRAPLGRRLGHRWGAVWVEFLGRPFAQTLGSPPRRRLGPGSWGVPLP